MNYASIYGLLWMTKHYYKETKFENHDQDIKKCLLRNKVGLMKCIFKFCYFFFVYSNPEPSNGM